MPNQTESFTFAGKEHSHQDGIVPIGGKLRHLVEVQTAKLLDLLLDLSSVQEVQKRQLRTKIKKWLYNRTRPGFYLEIKDNLHLAYAHQKDGHGTPHWWRLFYDETYKQKIETMFDQPSSIVPYNTHYEENSYWGSFQFRSTAEKKIAQELDKNNVLFFVNTKGKFGNFSHVSNDTFFNGAVEVDFLVYNNGKAIILEVDGKHHNESETVKRDYLRDRLLLKQGLVTVRFTGKECLNNPGLVVEEFLSL
ncbi:MAG: DUF559 domain-containing protein, partial [Gloeocapsa sp. DLM2.Bin57]